jgi:hypothetical protein
VDCPYMGPWTPIGGCNSDGKQYYRRDVVNSGADRNKSENCCYISAWSAWPNWGGCNGSTRSKTRSRRVLNCPAGTATTETETQSCNHCQGSWSGWSNWSGWSGYSSCPAKKKTRTQTRRYTITRNATNGGNSCPHPNGYVQTNSQSQGGRCKGH